jgi:hypothetical protein
MLCFMRWRKSAPITYRLPRDSGPNAKHVRPCLESQVMKNIGAFALCFAAIAVLFAAGAAAQEGQEEGQTRRVCRMVGYVNVCQEVYYPPPPSAPEPPVRRSTESTIRYNANDEERKTQLQATEGTGTFHRGTPPGSSLCAPPYRMTARDGCQR